MTRPGRRAAPWLLSALVAVAYLSALGRGHSLPWVLAALLFSALLCGLWLPHWQVARLMVRREAPGRAEEGETVELCVVLENPAWLPRFMVEVFDRLPADGSGAQSTERRIALLPYLPPRARRTLRVPLLCEKRGHYRLGPVTLATAFPLGLASARRSQGGEAWLTVYPELFALAALPLSGAPSRMHRADWPLPGHKGAAECMAVREYRAGDNPRHVHWRASARLGELVVREFEPTADALLCLVPDLARDANVGVGRQATLEVTLRICASIARAASAWRTPVRLQGAGAAPVRMVSGSGELQFRQMLDCCARLDADGDVPYAEVLREVGAQAAAGETLVLFLSEPAARAEATLMAIADLRARRLPVLAVLFDRSSFDMPGPDAAALGARLGALGVRCLPHACGDVAARLFSR
ncbi:DUF58 domain-containing protein [Crenobacter caeni]|uniref:DUF58 domain-containing protein n=1 Tax=Crenobacter caeni TaxID=2705474 RepID=A0A6B2KR52_9NEIS|nr:DUF58 domain-containing protein [Crenobacter caeni]NDV12563.1 DUF58 domain-containing protein [Crenobacter caeni]